MTLGEKDLQYIWHPYTHQKNRLLPIAINNGKGAVLIGEDGKKYIDATSSWWVNIHGHAHPYIAKKIFQQAKKLEHVIFTGFTHEPAVLLAEKLVTLLPGMSKVFYSDNGSTATEVAIKMGLHVRRPKASPRHNRTRLVHRESAGRKERKRPRG